MLSMLSAWLDVGRGPLLHFSPFVVEVLKRWAEDDPHVPPVQVHDRPVRPGELARALRDEWGFPMLTTDVERLLLDRALADGFLHDSNGGLYLNRDRLNGVPSLCEAKQELLSDMNAAIKDLCAYARRQHDVEWTGQVARSALERFTEHFGVELALARRRPLRPAPLLSDDEALAVVHAFARDAVENDPVNFRRLENMARGFILFNALYLPNVDNLWNPLYQLQVGIDAPIVLQALGLAGSPECAATADLLELLDALAGRVFVFEHTVQEVRGLIDRLVDHLRFGSIPGRRHRVPSRDREALDGAGRLGWNIDELQECSDNLLDRLRGLGIGVMTSPDHRVDGHLDEVRLDELVRDTMEHSELARRHDVDSIAKVIRLRTERPVRDLSEANVIFITNSSGLVRACEAFCAEQGLDATIPYVMLERRMIPLLWVRAPQRKTDLAAKLVLAECWAGMNPSAEEWERCLHHMKAFERKPPTPQRMRDIVEEYHGGGLFERPVSDPVSVNGGARDAAAEALTRLELQVAQQAEELVATQKRLEETARRLSDESAAREEAERARSNERRRRDAYRGRVASLRRDLSVLKEQKARRDRQRAKRKRLAGSCVAGGVGATVAAAIGLLLLGLLPTWVGWSVVIPALAAVALSPSWWATGGAPGRAGTVGLVALLATLAFGTWQVQAWQAEADEGRGGSSKPRSQVDASPRVEA